jgi:hypothetical protein
MSTFFPGLELSRRFYAEVVRPLVQTRFPTLPHAAALIGRGSEVLGFDTALSTDHDWGPSVFLFLREEDAGQVEAIDAVMRQELPSVFAGYPVQSPPTTPVPGMRLRRGVTEHADAHRVFPVTLRDFCWDYLAYDPVQPLDAVDWLTVPAQKLRGMTAGVVHHDGIGELTRLREQLTWYPREVWLYLLAAAWQRIGQEEHLMPRAGSVGDEVGSALIGSRLVRDIMRVGFLLERVYAPYPKWFGTAFQQLACAEALWSHLWQAQQAATWPEREAALSRAYEVLARLQNTSGLTEPLPEHVVRFYGRPFRVLNAERFAQTLLARISDPAVQYLATRPLIGSIDQFSDSTDLGEATSLRQSLRQLYR